MDMSITGVILAAGTSSRMGSINKLFLTYKSHTIIEEVVEQLSNSKVDNILIVTGFDNTRIERLPICSLTDRIRCIHNSNYHLGRLESVGRAIREIDGQADAALFTVGDKPGVTSDLIDKAIDRFVEYLPAILYVETPSGRGHPIVFSKEVFGDLMHLQGDHAGDELLAKYRDHVVKLRDETEQIDVDTEADYRRLLEQDAGEKVR
jgi:molybdenum cofactor cytidylyltransferase